MTLKRLERHVPSMTQVKMPLSQWNPLFVFILGVRGSERDGVTLFFIIIIFFVVVCLCLCLMHMHSFMLTYFSSPPASADSRFPLYFVASVNISDSSNF